MHLNVLFRCIKINAVFAKKDKQTAQNMQKQ